MTVVVSDTSPIRALNHLGLLWLLERIFGVVYVPPAVAEELLHPRQGSAIDVRGVSFFDVRAPVDPNRAHALANNLDPAEIEAISLAIELKAPFVLIDESAGRAGCGKSRHDFLRSTGFGSRKAFSLRDWVIRSAGEDRG